MAAACAAGPTPSVSRSLVQDRGGRRGRPARRYRCSREWMQMLQRLALLPCICILLLFAHRGAGAPSEDKIGELPGQPKVSFGQYSGFVTVNEEHGRALFYYFTEASANASSKPLVLWLNGGPGCSSVGGGGFTELGPFFPNGYGDGLIANNYSWNLVANILFLESPAGVGFSYSNTSADLDSWDDAKVAYDSFIFLLRWLDKFPEYKGKDFYIAGESYAGHYIPDLAALLVNYSKIPGNYNFNLKGLLIGNPLFNLGVDSQSTYDFLWSHGLLSEQTHEAIAANCVWEDYSTTPPYYNESVACVEAINQCYVEINENYINPYHVTIDICLPAAGQQERNLQRHIAESLTQISLGVDVCVEEEEFLYLNSAEVQKALHVSRPTKWSICSRRVGKGYHIADLQRDILPILGDLARSGVRLLVFSGDQDSVIPLIGTRQLIIILAQDLNLRAATSYKNWVVNQQVAGWFQVFGEKNEVTYATVRGAAHMVPYTQPARALQLFSSFLEDRKLPTKHPKLP